jgi:hypothetical protein
MATKELKLGKETISEILIADTDSGSDAGVSDVEDEFEEEEDEQQQQQLLLQQASAEDEAEDSTSGEGLPP